MTVTLGKKGRPQKCCKKNHKNYVKVCVEKAWKEVALKCYECYWLSWDGEIRGGHLFFYSLQNFKNKVLKIIFSFLCQLLSCLISISNFSVSCPPYKMYSLLPVAGYAEA